MADLKEIPEQTISRLTAELAAANKIIATLEAAKKQLTDDEKIIREKMAHGLSREQAINVINRQRAHDAREKHQAAAKAAKAAKE